MMVRTPEECYLLAEIYHNHGIEIEFDSTGRLESVGGTGRPVRGMWEDPAFPEIGRYVLHDEKRVVFYPDPKRCQICGIDWKYNYEHVVIDTHDGSHLLCGCVCAGFATLDMEGALSADKACKDRMRSYDLFSRRVDSTLVRGWRRSKRGNLRIGIGRGAFVTVFPSRFGGWAISWPGRATRRVVKQGFFTLERTERERPTFSSSSFDDELEAVALADDVIEEGGGLP